MSVRRVPATGEAGYERRSADAYWTETWVTQALLDAVRLPGPVWEPACGRGDMVEVLKRNGYEVRATDLHNHGYGEPGRDFLTEPTTSSGAIVTNPPYSLAESFVFKALNLTEPGLGMVAMLLRHEFDCAKSRRSMFKEHPAFTMKLTLTRRPRWVDGEQKASPRFNFAWYVWDWRSAGREPVVRWA